MTNQIIQFFHKQQVTLTKQKSSLSENLTYKFNYLYLFN